MDEKVVMLDIDTGIDDALGLLLAIQSPVLRIVGVTTCFGATSCGQATENTLRILQLANLSAQIPVAKGAERPLEKRWDGPVVKIHGSNGIGEVDLPVCEVKEIDLEAADFIIQMAEIYKNTLVLVCTARLTNLAIALRRNPRIKNWIKEVVVMGGAVYVPGNVTSYAEANIHDDPEAASVVFGSGLNITMVGLDVTQKVRVTDKELEKISERNEQACQSIGCFAEEILRYYIRAYRTELEIEGCMLHDPLAVAVCMDPSLVSVEQMGILVDTSNVMRLGQTRACKQEDMPQVNVCIDVDAERAKRVFLQSLFEKGNCDEE